MTLDIGNILCFFYSKCLYFLNHSTPIELPVVDSYLWNKDVPLKVLLFAWRLFRDRLHTKDNIHCRGVIDLESMVCVAGCGSTESSNHFSCIVLFLGLSRI